MKVALGGVWTRNKYFLERSPVKKCLRVHELDIARLAASIIACIA